MHKRLVEEMNAISAPMDPDYDHKVAQLGRLLKERNINGYEIQRALDDSKVCDDLADILRIIRISKTDLSGSLDSAAIRRVVNFLFNFDVKRARQFNDDLPWYGTRDDGFMPSELYDEARFRMLLEGMDDDYLSVLVLRKGLLSGIEVPAGELAEQYKVPVKDITTLLQRANKYVKSQQAEHFPFYRKRKYHYGYLYQGSSSLESNLISDEFRPSRDGFHIEGARDRILDAGITTVGELIELPKRQAARLLLGPSRYLPVKHFPL